MKKLLLSIGTLGAVVAPVTTVVACGWDANFKTKQEFKASKQFANVADFAEAVIIELGGKTNAELVDGVTFGIDNKSFSTIEGKYFTEIKETDLKDVSSFTAWLNKLKGTYTSIQTEMTGYTGDDEAKATWIIDEIAKHPNFAEKFGFKAPDVLNNVLPEEKTALVARGDYLVKVLNNITSTVQAMVKGLI